MIHLFNNVFLEQSYHIDYMSRFILISNYADNTVELNDNCIKAGKTLEEVLGEDSLEDFIKQVLSMEGKVVVYCDNEPFSEIATSWIKSTTNMDQDAFDSWVSCYQFKSEVYSRPNNQLMELMKASWEDAEEYDFSKEDFSPSFEFALASALHDRDFKYKDKFKVLLSKFIKREYEQQILEARKHLDTYILDADLQKLLGGSGKTLEDFRELPRMSIYREPFFRDTIDNVPPNQAYWPGKVSKLDVSKGTAEEIAELCELSDEINIAIMNMSVPAGMSGSVNGELYQSRGWEYMSSVREGVLTDDEYNKALDEILAEKIAMVHVPFDLREHILFVFLPLVKSLKQENDLERLEKYTLK
jgi:hypothetical protein